MKKILDTIPDAASCRFNVSNLDSPHYGRRSRRWKGILASMILLLVMADAAQPPLEVPREPDVKPNVPPLGKDDENENLIDDKIDKEIQEANAVLADSTASAAAEAQAKARLAEGINVLVSFNRQITKAELETFVAMGGEVRIIFRNVTYGWSGTIARGQIPSFVTSMGPGFVGIRKPKPIRGRSTAWPARFVWTRISRSTPNESRYHRDLTRYTGLHFLNLNWL